MCAIVAMNFESVSLWIAVASSLISMAAVWIVKSSLFLAKQAAERDRKIGSGQSGSNHISKQVKPITPSNTFRVGTMPKRSIRQNA
jgi:hypothetical protein